MIHPEVEPVRNHHSNNLTSSNAPHQTSPTLAQKTPFAIQELLGLTNNPSDHESMNSSVKLQSGEQQNNPFSYYNSKVPVVNDAFIRVPKLGDYISIHNIHRRCPLDLIPLHVVENAYWQLHKRQKDLLANQTSCAKSLCRHLPQNIVNSSQFGVNI